MKDGSTGHGGLLIRAIIIHSNGCETMVAIRCGKRNVVDFGEYGQMGEVFIAVCSFRGTAKVSILTG